MVRKSLWVRFPCSAPNYYENRHYKRHHKKDLLKIVAISNSKTEVLDKLNLYKNAATRSILNSKLEEFGIDKFNKKVKYCKNCNNIISNENKYFCSVPCRKDFEYKQYIIEWKKGIRLGYKGKSKQISNYIRKYLLEKYNYSCIKCGWAEKHPIDNLPLVEINHIDGNAENNEENNLEVLCPNCHSMTPNFRARNKSSKRER